MIKRYKINFPLVILQIYKCKIIWILTVYTISYSLYKYLYMCVSFLFLGWKASNKIRASDVNEHMACKLHSCSNAVSKCAYKYSFCILVKNYSNVEIFF